VNLRAPITLLLQQSLVRNWCGNELLLLDFIEGHESARVTLIAHCTVTFSKPGQRALQYEARAHIGLQTAIMRTRPRRLADRPVIHHLLHERFCSRLPKKFCGQRTRTNGERLR